jgi:hypothetical protein
MTPETQAAPETQEKETIIITKMSVKGINCKPTGTNPATPLCVMYGRATDVKTGENKDGTIWSALTGSFEAVNLQTGDIYKSGKLFLPGGIHETVESAVRGLKQAEKEGSTSVAVEFALEIRSIEAKNPIGYSYQAVNLRPARATDELDPLRKAILESRQKRQALPPAPPEQPAPAGKAVKK